MKINPVKVELFHADEHIETTKFFAILQTRLKRIMINLKLLPRHGKTFSAVSDQSLVFETRSVPPKVLPEMQFPTTIPVSKN